MTNMTNMIDRTNMTEMSYMPCSNSRYSQSHIYMILLLWIPETD